MSTVSSTTSRTAEITELETETVNPMRVKQEILRSQVRVDNALLVDKLDGFCCLGTLFQSKGKTNGVIVLIKIIMQITITGFSEEEPSWICRRADEPFKALI